MRSRTEWQAWGRIDPLYGVSSWQGKNKKGSAPWTDAEFYEFGRACWLEYENLWRRYGLTTASCVEIGCGAGRITKQLARVFAQVHALDVSAEMIEYAKSHVDARVTTFHLTTGNTLPLPPACVTAAFSTDVFQHFDVLAEGEGYFREIFRVLAPRGTMMVHLPIHHWPSQPALHGVIHGATDGIALWRDNLRRLIIRLGAPRPFMRGISYPAGWVFGILDEIGFRNIEILTYNPTRSQHRAFRSYVFATKLPDPKIP